MDEAPLQLVNGTLRPLGGGDGSGSGSGEEGMGILRSKGEYLKAVAYEGVTVLQGTATWCRQCAAIAPEITKMIAEYPDVHFFTYDIETCDEVAMELGVSRVPGYSVFRDGDIQEGVTGAKPKEIRKAIEACL